LSKAHDGGVGRYISRYGGNINLRESEAGPRWNSERDGRFASPYASGAQSIGRSIGIGRARLLEGAGNRVLMMWRGEGEK
jgi:hypothetical protein